MIKQPLSVLDEWVWFLKKYNKFGQNWLISKTINNSLHKRKKCSMYEYIK